MFSVLAMLLLLASMGVWGCGGGSGGGGALGAVVKAPINGATVEAQTAAGSWVTVGTTTSTGAVSFTNLGALSSADYPAILRATGGTTVGGDAFAGELRGVLENSSSSVYMTPAGTILAYLFETSGDLAGSISQVRGIIQNELGYADVDPFANPLASTTFQQQYEQATQALLVVLGVGEESNTAAMQNLATTMQDVATSLNSGNTLATVAAQKSGYSSATDGSLANYVTNNEATIQQRAKTALNVATLATTTVDTTQKPVKLKVVSGTDMSSTEKVSYNVAKTAGQIVTFKVSAVNNSASDPNWTSQTDAQYTITALPSVGTLYVGTSGSGTEAATGTAYNSVSGNSTSTGVAAGDGTNFTFLVTAAAASSSASSVTISFASSKTSTIVRTVTINLIASGTAAVDTLGMTVAGDAGTLFLVGTAGSTTNIANNSSRAFTSTSELRANLTAFASTNSTAMNDAFSVRFLAPEGFAFRVGSANSTNYDLASIAGSGTAYTVSVPTTVSLITTKAVPFGKRAFQAILRDSDGNEVKRTSSDFYAVASGAQNYPAEMNTVRYRYSNGTSVASANFSVNGTNEITFAAGSSVTAQIKTWTDLAGGASAVDPTIIASGVWRMFLDVNPGTGYGIQSGSSYSSNVDVGAQVTFVDPTLSVNVSGTNFKPNYGTTRTNQDLIKIQFTDSTRGIQLISVGGATINSQP